VNSRLVFAIGSPSSPPKERIKGVHRSGGGSVAGTDPSVIEELGEGLPALE
jgi:hypothetical protein